MSLLRLSGPEGPVQLSPLLAAREFVAASQPVWGQDTGLELSTHLLTGDLGQLTYLLNFALESSKNEKRWDLPHRVVMRIVSRKRKRFASNHHHYFVRVTAPFLTSFH